MSFPVYATSLNALTHHVCGSLLTEGTRTPSRNGETVEVCDVELFLVEPQNRHLYLEGRTNNIYGTLGEVFWLLAEQTEISPVLEKFVPRAVNYSDDGKTWRAGYGERLFESNQIDHACQMFIKDGKNTRRSVMSIWQPNKDTIEAVQEQGYPDSKDYPCSNFLWYWVRDNKFNCKLGMRSNDWIFGGSNINIVEFTILQEIMLRLLQNARPEVFNEVQLGYYHHSVISLHLYDATIKQAENIVANKDVNLSRGAALKNFDISIGKHDYKQLKMFFRDIYYSFWNNSMQNESYDRVTKVFESHNVPRSGNQLYAYAILAEAYLDNLAKKPVDFNLMKSYLSDDLYEAVKHNKFTPKEWLV